jgi:hypothetical protein
LKQADENKMRKIKKGGLSPSPLSLEQSDDAKQLAAIAGCDARDVQ